MNAKGFLKKLANNFFELDYSIAPKNNSSGKMLLIVIANVTIIQCDICTDYIVTYPIAFCH